MRSLLTGSAGFLGSHIARKLVESGDEVIALYRKSSDLSRLEPLRGSNLNFAVLNEDYSNIQEILGETRPDNVIHLAAKSRGGESPAEIRDYIDSNITLGSHLLLAMQATGVLDLVNAGTSWQWGEDGSYRPFNFYAATKQGFEDVLAHFNQSGMRSITLRVFDTIGPGDDRRRIADLLLDAGLAGETLKMSPGGQNMHLVDVRDAANAFVHCARMLPSLAKGENRVYALRTDPPVNLRQLVPIVVEATGVSVDVEFGGRPYRDRELMSPFAGHPVPPGWTAERTLPDTLRDMMVGRRVLAGGV